MSIRKILDINDIKITKKDKIICIYKITSPSGKIYIGSTVNFYKRIGHYIYNKNLNEQPKVFNSFNKYGIYNHKFEILEVINIENLNEKEIEYIEKFDSLKNGLNLTTGGRTYFFHSEESRKKISVSKMGKKCSEETKLKISNTLTGRPGLTKGRKKTEEEIKKLTLSLKNREWKMSEEHKEQISIASKKRWELYRKNKENK